MKRFGEALGYCLEENSTGKQPYPLAIKLMGKNQRLFMLGKRCGMRWFKAVEIVCLKESRCMNEVVYPGRAICSGRLGYWIYVVIQLEKGTNCIYYVSGGIAT